MAVSAQHIQSYLSVQHHLLHISQIYQQWALIISIKSYFRDRECLLAYLIFFSFNARKLFYLNGRFIHNSIKTGRKKL